MCFQILMTSTVKFKGTVSVISSDLPSKEEHSLKPLVNPRCKWSLRSGTACNSLLCSLGIYRLLKEDDNQCCFFKFVNTVQRIYWTYDRSRLSDGCCNIIFKKGSQFKQKDLSTQWTDSKVWRVLLWIVHCPLCQEGHLKLRLQSL